MKFETNSLSIFLISIELQLKATRKSNLFQTKKSQEPKLQLVTQEQ